VSNGLQKDLRQIPPSFGRFAGLDAIDSIKRAYYDLEKSNANAPQLSTPAPIGMPQVGMESLAPQAMTPDQIPDEEIAAAFKDPRERFAAFVAKYGAPPPPTADQYFSLLDELSMKE
jgi:hypothetical protein